MKVMKKKTDNRLVLLEALLRYADQSGDDKPQFSKDDMLRRLGVCEHVFNIMQKQLGDGCCRLVDSFDGGGRYAINVSRCYALRKQLSQASTEESYREGLKIKVLTTLISTLFVILLSHVIL